MTDHVSEERLNDWLDDAVGAGEAREIKEHLARCPACAAESHRLRRVVEGLRELPRTLPVPDRVWDAVQARTSREAPWRLMTARFAPFPVRAVAAAGIVLVAVVLLVALRDRDGARRAEDRGASRPAALATLTRIEEECAVAQERLQATLEADRAALPPDAAAALDSSLASLDRAASRIHAALQAAPEQPRLAAQVRRIRLQKLALLQRAFRITRSGS